MNRDLISREAALRIAEGYCPDDDGSCSKADADMREMLDEIEDLPAVDAVEVVRCGDCMWRGNERKCPMCWTEYYDDPDDGADTVFRDNTTDDGFCHCGERAGGEEDGDA